MARFFRILFWKVLVYLSPGPTSRFSYHFRGANVVCDGIGGALLFSPFSAYGTDALEEPFGGTDTPRELQPSALRLGVPTPLAPVSSFLRTILSRGKITALEGGRSPTAAAERDMGDLDAASERQEDKLASDEVETRDMAGLPEAPPTLEVDLEEKGEKGEDQELGRNKPVYLGRGPAQTPEPVAAAPPPLMPSLDLHFSFDSLPGSNEDLTPALTRPQPNCLSRLQELCPSPTSLKGHHNNRWKRVLPSPMQGYGRKLS